MSLGKREVADERVLLSGSGCLRLSWAASRMCGTCRSRMLCSMRSGVRAGDSLLKCRLW